MKYKLMIGKMKEFQAVCSSCHGEDSDLFTAGNAADMEKI